MAPFLIANAVLMTLITVAIVGGLGRAIRLSRRAAGAPVDRAIRAHRPTRAGRPADRRRWGARPPLTA